jgi:hypothetical protein
MTRALQKHVARRQDQTFADWFAELRELAGERWADVADQAPTIYAVGAAVRRRHRRFTWWGSFSRRRQRRHNHKPLPNSRQGVFAKFGGANGGYSIPASQRAARF